MLEKIFDWIRKVRQKMFGQRNFYEKAGVPPSTITTDMVIAIDRWCNLYENRAPWLAKDPKSLCLPARIAAEIATMVTVEMEMKVVSKNEHSKARAEFLNKQLDKVRDCIRKQTEYACAKGGLVFKPYIDGVGISYEYVQADDFYPCAFDSRGDITSAVFLARKQEGNRYYTRIEKHVLDGTTYTVTNRAFVGMSQDEIGQEVPLTQITEWKFIDPVTKIENIEHPLFAYFAIPLGNTIDPKSPIGVSVYAKADSARLIEEADKQFQRLMWEFEGGELAIDASMDAFKTKGGIPELPTGKERLYRINKLDSATVSDELMKTFSPTLRDESITSGLQTILKQIEDTTGLSRGTLADPDKEALTATQIKTQKQRTYATVSSIQKALENALRLVVNASDSLATLYSLAPEGDIGVNFVWDDSVIVDAEAERQRDMEEVSNGLMQKWEYRVKWYGEDEQTAKRMTADAQTDDEIMGFGLPNKQPVQTNPATAGEREGSEQ